MALAQYIILNKSAAWDGKPMSTGKAAAQAAHAAVIGYNLSLHEHIDEWEKSPTKLVLEVADEHALRRAHAAIIQAGYLAEIFVDGGPTTEGTEGVATALAIEIVDRHDPDAIATFSKYKLYSDTSGQDPPVRSRTFAHWASNR